MLKEAFTLGLVYVWLVTGQVAGASESVQIEVDADCAYVVGGHRKVHDMIFGWTAYEGAPIPATPRREVLRVAGIECLGFPGAIRWCAPPELPNKGIRAWYESKVAMREITSAEPLNGARYMYGKILPACRRLGIEPMIYLLGGPPWAMGPQNIPKDPQQYAQLVVGYVGLLKRIDPKLRWFHLDNEPNARWFHAGKGGKEYGQLFRVVAEAVHKAHGDVKIGGPVLCWPPAWPPSQKGQPNWYTWDGWTKAFLDAAGDQVDFFDYHDYNGKVDVLLEEITTLANELRLRRGKEVPILITESGIRLDEKSWREPAAHWKRRTLPWARYLLALLEHPDKVYSNQMHDLSAKAGGWFRVLGPSPEQTPTYWLYWVFRHLRGDRVKARAVGPPSMRTFATRGSGKVAVLVFNDADEPADVTLSFQGIGHAGSVRWDRLQFDPQTGKVVRESGQGREVALKPRGFCCAWVEVPVGVSPKRSARRVELFGKSVMNELTGREVGVDVDVPTAALTEAVSARIRVGTLGNAPGEKLAMRIGGRRYSLRSGTYFQEVRLHGVPPAGLCRITFRCDSGQEVVASRPGDHRLRISSVTLVIEQAVR